MDDPKKRALPSIDAAEFDGDDAEPVSKVTRLPKPAAPLLDPAMVAMIAMVVAEANKPIIEALQAIVTGQSEAATAAIEAARKPRRPESYRGDFPFPNISVFTPDGQPLAPLACETWLGVYWTDEGTGERKISAEYQYLDDEAGGSTREERQLLDAIPAGVYEHIRCRDGKTGVVRVQVREDEDGKPYRKILAVPKDWLSKERKNLIGGVEFLRQLLPSRESAAVA